MKIGDKITDGTTQFIVRSTGGYRVSIMSVQTIQAI
jgi:hypothetical protein